MRECKKERAGSSVGQATSLLFMAIAFAVACLMPAEAAAQKVNLRVEQGTTLDEAFRRIIKDSRVQLVYNTQEAAAIRCDGAHFRQQELRDVLQALLANTPLTYVEKEGIYTIVRKKAAPQTEPEKTKERKLTGRVVDEQGEPLVGAAVLMKNEKQGTITDANGNFVFEHAPEEAVLVISYIGKVKIEQSVKPGRKNTFVMQEDENLTAEVVVTGYQTISKERATGAYSIVGAPIPTTTATR